MIDRILDLTRDSFAAVIQLRRVAGGAPVDPAQLHARLCGYVDALIGRARAADVGPDDLGDLVYALVALADEVALSQPGPVQQHWMANLLQLRYFNENLAGENFFRRLETLRADPRRAPILAVYYLCLLLGFQGRYRVRGGEAELGRLVDALREDLAQRRVIVDAPLAPHGRRPADERGLLRRGLPIAALAAAAVVAAIAVNVALHVSLGERTADVAGRIEALAGPGAPR